MRALLTAVWLLLATCAQAASGFYTQRLELMAQTLHLSAASPADSLSANGRRLRVSRNIYGDVAHIGYRMFSDEAMAIPKYAPALTFIERYLLELDLRLDGRAPAERMDIDRVTLTKGGLRQLRQADASTPFSIDVLTRRMYKVAWDVGGATVEMVFPADAQLLIGADAVELENMMKRDVRRVIPMGADDVINAWDEAKVSRSGKNIIVEGGKYLSDEIRGDIYLTELHGRRTLVCTPRNARASIANIMLTGQFGRPLPMRLRLDKYGYRADEMDITLQQFVDYCKSEGCKLYFGVKTIDRHTLTGTLFAYNETLAYNHVLSVSVPLAILDGKDARLEATAYAYIPLQNVTEKFFTNDIHDESIYKR